VGTCGAGRWDAEAGVAEVAYELTPAVQGRGLATAAVRAFVSEARAAGLQRVEAHTWVGNAASARVLERCGFEREAHLPAFRDCRGERRDFWRWGCRLG
jgi:ribosomal-protein-alanine N-acetyltransferase